MDKIYSQIKGRIIYFIENKNITKDLFFKKTGIASSNFKGNNSKSELGGDKIAKILTEYPEISAEWLLTGKGEMLKDNGSVISQTIKGNGNISNDNINIPIQTTSQELSEDKELLKELRNIIKDKDKIIADKDRTIEELREELKEKREELKELKEELKEVKSELKEIKEN